jgi:hypothetical protein
MMICIYPETVALNLWFVNLLVVFVIHSVCVCNFDFQLLTVDQIENTQRFDEIRSVGTVDMAVKAMCKCYGRGDGCNLNPHSKLFLIT